MRVFSGQVSMALLLCCLISSSLTQVRAASKHSDDDFGDDDHGFDESHDEGHGHEHEGDHEHEHEHGHQKEHHGSDDHHDQHHSGHKEHHEHDHGHEHEHQPHGHKQLEHHSPENPLKGHFGLDSSLLGSVSDGISTLIGGPREALHSGGLLGGLMKGDKDDHKTDHKDGHKDDHKGDYKGDHKDNKELGEPVKSFGDFYKLALNPIELTKYISTQYKLPLDKLVDRIGSGLVVGLEAMLQPLLACIKIVEKVFQPDQCRLKFICKMGSRFHFVHQYMLKFTPNFVDSSAYLKSMSEGLSGKECDVLYGECGSGLKLKKPFEELKDLKESKSEIKEPLNSARQLGGSFKSAAPAASIASTSSGPTAASSAPASAPAVATSKAA